MISRRISLVARAGLTIALSGGLAAAPALFPVAAYAETSSELSSQLETAQAKLDDLSKQLEIAQAAVSKTQTQLDQTEADIATLKDQISEQKTKLSEARAALSQTIVSSYKSGGTSLLDIVMSSEDFSELTSRIFYANRVAESNGDKVDEVNTLIADLNSKQDELSKKQSELSDLLSQQKETEAAAQAAQSEAESYVNGLSSELQEALAQERAAAAERQRAAAEQAVAAAGSASSTGGAQQSPSTSQPSQGSGGGSSSGGAVSSGGLSSAQRSTIVSAATSQLGVPYVWGASNPGVSMDCSGLSSYAYGQAGVSIRRTAEEQYSQVCAAGNLKSSVGSLVAGDLVFYASGGYIYHVGVYIGGGQVCHANGYGQGVVITSVTYDDGFCGGGSPV